MLLERAELWNPRDGRVFRTPPWGSLVMALLFGGATCGFAWGSLRGPLGGFGWLFVLPFSLLTWVVLKSAVRAFSQANWVLIVRDTGLALKFRSYLNSDLPKRDDVVAWIPREDVRAVRKVGRTRDLPSESDAETQTEKVAALDILLKHTDTDALAEACKRERSFRGEGRMQFHHYPVSVPEPGCVRIEWNSERQKLSPGVDQALALLGESYEVREELAQPHQDWRKLDDQALEGLILELADSGRRLQAKKMVRLRYDMSLTEASRFVDDLVA